MQQVIRYSRHAFFKSYIPQSCTSVKHSTCTAFQTFWYLNPRQSSTVFKYVTTCFYQPFRQCYAHQIETAAECTASYFLNTVRHYYRREDCLFLKRSAFDLNHRIPAQCLRYVQYLSTRITFCISVQCYRICLFVKSIAEITFRLYTGRIISWKIILGDCNELLQSVFVACAFRIFYRINLFTVLF